MTVMSSGHCLRAAPVFIMRVTPLARASYDTAINDAPPTETFRFSVRSTVFVSFCCDSYWQTAQGTPTSDLSSVRSTAT